jgi:CRP-like cAMP-binding protein
MAASGGLRGSVVVRLALVAGLLSAGKVLLYTAGTTLFLARDGIAGLPLLYVTLAVLATLVSIGLGHIVDRVPGGRLLPGLALAIAVVVAGLLGGLVLGLAWAPMGLLLAAHLYDIVTDIVFWVLVAAFLDNLRLRRLTTRLYIAIAIGGSTAGILAERALVWLSPGQLLLPVILLAGLAALALWPVAVPPTTGAGGEAGEVGTGLGDLGRFLARHPFALLLALNSMMLTVVYSLTEFVCFALYAETYADEAELGRFLALIFAGLQLAELAVLWLAARGVVERAGPFLRNLLFPLGSLACLAALLAQPRLAWAILAHVNTEAVSNAVFEPVNTTNYGALPAAVHGRARTLADGVFYPVGMALAGLVLAILPADDAAFRARVLALVAAGFFVLLNLVVAQRYLPTLVRHLRHGQRPRLPAAPRRRAASGDPAIDPARLLPLLASRRAADRLLAVDLVEAALARAQPEAAEALVAALATALVGVAPRLGETDWARVVAILARAGPDALVPALEAATARTEREAMSLLGAACLLAGGAPRVPVAGDVALALADLLGGCPWMHPNSTADQVSPGWRNDAQLIGRLAAVVRRAPPALTQHLAQGIGHAETPEELRQALLEAVLRHPPKTPDPALLVLAEEGRHAAAPAHRAMALGALAAMLPPAELLGPGMAALTDPSRQVRRVAVDALLPLADRALAVLLVDGGSRGAASLGVIELLAAVDSRPARRLLRRLIAGLAELAERDARLLDRIAAAGDTSLAPLHAALLDHARSLTDRLFAGLGALGEAGHAMELRRALGEADTRLVAGGIDGLVSLRHGQLARRFVPLLERLHLPHQGAAADQLHVRAGASADTAIERLVEDIDGRWLRAATRLLRRRRADAPAAPDLPTPTDEVAMPIFAPPARSTHDDRLFEAMLRLKRFDLLAELPLDALEVLAPLVEERRFAAGMTIQRGGGVLPLAWLVDEGSVEVSWPDGRIETEGPGGIIGETALVDPTVTAPGVTAGTACRLLQLHRITFEDIARDHPALTEALCRLLARRLREARLHRGRQPDTPTTQMARQPESRRETASAVGDR